MDEPVLEHHLQDGVQAAVGDPLLQVRVLLRGQPHELGDGPPVHERLHEHPLAHEPRERRREPHGRAPARVVDALERLEVRPEPREAGPLQAEVQSGSFCPFSGAASRADYLRSIGLACTNRLCGVSRCDWTP